MPLTCRQCEHILLPSRPVRAGLIDQGLKTPCLFSPAIVLASQFVTEDMMKHLRQACLGLFLLLALSIPAFAGDMHAPKVAGDMQCGVTGDMPTGGVTGDIPGLGATGDILGPGITGDIHCGITGDLLSLFLALF